MCAQEIPIQAEAEAVKVLGEASQKIAEVEAKVDELAKVVATVKTGVEEFGRISRIAAMVGAWKCQNCAHRKDSVCSAWVIPPDRAESIKSLVGPDAVVEQEGKLRLDVGKAQLFAVFCPLFKLRS